MGKEIVALSNKVAKTIKNTKKRNGGPIQPFIQTRLVSNLNKFLFYGIK